MKGLKLIAVGGALPRRIITNEFLTKQVDTSDAWIRERTGIEARHFCEEEENTTTLALTAARAALERSGLASEDIDLCIAATISGEYQTPSLACLIQQGLGLKSGIPCFDVNAACTGFIYAASTAPGILEATGGKYALVIGAEQMSKIIDMSDRNTCVLFGDGAGAGIFRLDDNEDTHYAVSLAAAGDKAIVTPGPGDRKTYLDMDGKAVYRFAIEALPKAAETVLEKSGLTLDEVEHVVCHQANARILDSSIRRLGADPAKFFRNIAKTGNTSAASVPLALSDLYEEGGLKLGEKVLLVGFGGGLTWGGMLVEFEGSVKAQPESD